MRFFIVLLLIPVVSGQMYVEHSAGCNDEFTRLQALDPSTPWCSVVRACAAAQSGDLILIRSGEYNGQCTISGDFTRRVVLTAYPGEQVILSNYDERYAQANSRWTREGDHWVTDFDPKGTAMLQHSDGSMVLAWSKLSEFQATERESVYFDDVNNKVLLKSDLDPNTIQLYMSTGPVIRIDGANNVQISNLIIKNGKYCVYLSDSSDILLEGNELYGGYECIYANGKPMQRLNITGNKLHGYFDAAWSWDMIKSGKASRLETSAMHIIDVSKDLTIEDNEVSGYFNGILLQNDVTLTNLLLKRNKIATIYDDAIELETEYSGAIIDSNEVDDAFVGISLAYSHCENDCQILSNKLNAQKQILWDDTGYKAYGECFKIGRDDGMTTGWYIHHNTCVAKNHGIWGSSMDGQGDNSWLHNIFSTVFGYPIFKSGYSSTGLRYDNNVYYSSDGQLFSSYDGSESYKTLSAAQKLGNGWDTHSVQADPKLQSFTPAADSPACNISGGYAGAEACGSAPVVQAIRKSGGGGGGGGSMPKSDPISLPVKSTARSGELSVDNLNIYLASNWDAGYFDRWWNIEPYLQDMW